MNRPSRWLLTAALALFGCQQTVMLENAPHSGAGGQMGEGQADAGGPGANFGSAGGQVGGGPDLGAVPTSPADAGEERPAVACSGPRRFLEFRITRPDVVISFDRSSSMSATFGDGTRLSVTQQAVRDAVRAYQGAVLFGYQEFPITNTACSTAGCCVGTVSYRVRNNYDEIDRRMNQCEVRGTCSTSASTPTAEALARCRAAFNSGNSVRDRYILLITDGEPSCPRGRDMMTACEDAISEVVTLNNESNVKTIVVGVGDEGARSECLDEMAALGGMPRGAVSPRHYPARDPALVKQYIGEAVKTVAKRACHIDVLTPPDPLEQVKLLFDSQQVDRDPTEKNGWNFDGNTTVQISVYGAPCEQLQRGQIKDIDLVAECPPGSR